ncbi:MAG: CoA ester lyase [Betaproteobacteria bacterium]|nr:CoA ester lyase [Betaproteobacteria bacterium]
MRCKLFVPGSRPELFAKAMAGDADAISIDLEDAVDESRKDRAREEVARFLRELPADKAKTIIVRVNGVGTPHFERDIEAISGPGLDLVNQPMPESGDEVRACAEAMRRVAKAKGLAAPAGIMANIETPAAFRRAAEIATADPLVKGLQIGFGDLLEPYGIERYDPRVVLHFQLGVKLAAAEAGIFAYDSAMADVKNVAFLREEAETARRLGFLGKSAIHPSQVAVINAVFRPTEAEIAHSLKVVASATENAAKGVGAWTVDGKMIDAPFVARAQAVLAVARRLGLVHD